MKRFEAIDEEIEYLEILNSSDNKQLLSELKQITDEHSEMVALLKQSRVVLDSWELYDTVDEIDTFLTKINDK